jgi:hypothetical protein
MAQPTQTELSQPSLRRRAALSLARPTPDFHPGTLDTSEWLAS